MIKFFLLFLISFPTYAWIKPKVFDSSYSNLEEAILRSTISSKFENANSALEQKTVEIILNDKKNLVDDDFKIPKYFESSVKFWFSIYTQYTSKQVVIHDKEDLGIVYNIIDFSELNRSSINKYAKAKIQAQLSLEYTRRLKKILNKLSLNKRNLSKEEKGIYDTVAKSVSLPKSKSKRRKFFKSLAQNIRTQTGQRDMIFSGVIRAIPYFPYLEKKIEYFGLPKELLAITFLESSFNPNAYSKVGAAGAWQFMPFIASLFMPKRTNSLDYRLNPIVSSISAFHLLKQNKQILKRWDLAVTAYNSGTKHIIRAKRKFKKNKNIGLDFILENYDHAHLGFASKNFFSEFLALVHVLAYKNVIYPLQGFEKESLSFRNDHLHIYLAKCTVHPKSIFKALEKSSPKIKNLNAHFRFPNRKYKRGSLIVSDIELTKLKYVKVKESDLKRYYPKKWSKFLYKKRCGKL